MYMVKSLQHFEPELSSN